MKQLLRGAIGANGKEYVQGLYGGFRQMHQRESPVFCDSLEWSDKERRWVRTAKARALLGSSPCYCDWCMRRGRTKMFAHHCMPSCMPLRGGKLDWTNCPICYDERSKEMQQDPLPWKSSARVQEVRGNEDALYHFFRFKKVEGFPEGLPEVLL